MTKYHVDFDDVRYPRDGVSIDYASNDYNNHNRDLKLFYRESVGEELLNLFISYTDMKTKYPIKVIDFRFQFDLFNSEKIQLFEEFRGETNNARLFMILIRHRQVKVTSDRITNT